MASAATSKTTTTYDAIACRYHEQWRDRTAIREHIERFAAMLVAYGLDEQLVLDVGCGPGFDAAILRDRGLRVAGVDLSLGMLAVGCREYPGPFLQADMRCLPVAPCIGGLWVAASLLHLNRRDVPITLERFAGALLPGGLLYLSLKIGEGDDWNDKLYDRPRYFTYWQPEELDPLLDAVGLQIVDGWEGDGEIDRWLVRFARKSSRSTGLDLPCGDKQAA